MQLAWVPIPRQEKPRNPELKVKFSPWITLYLYIPCQVFYFNEHRASWCLFYPLPSPPRASVPQGRNFVLWHNAICGITLQCYIKNHHTLADPIVSRQLHYDAGRDRRAAPHAPGPASTRSGIIPALCTIQSPQLVFLGTWEMFRIPPGSSPEYHLQQQSFFVRFNSKAPWQRPS